MLTGMSDVQRMKLLLIVPHPDDEVYGAAGTLMELLAGATAAGWSP